jgi:hypothetical protein
MIIARINVSEETLHNRPLTKIQHQMMPLHSNEDLTNFPESNRKEFYICCNLSFISFEDATAKDDWF